MATWEFPLPDGTKVTGEGATKEAAWKNYLYSKRIKDIGTNAPASEKPTPRGQWQDIFYGVGQGLLDPIEGMVQMAEHVANHKIAPDTVRNWAKDFRKNVQSTWAGRAGELGGNIAGLALPGAGLARTVSGMARAIPKVSAAVGDIVGSGTSGALMGESIPVQGAQTEDEYWNTKRNQAAAGALAGGTLPSVARGLRSVVPPSAHFSYHHPWFSVLPRLARGTGNVLHQIAPESAGAAAATAEEEAARDEK